MSTSSADGAATAGAGVVVILFIVVVGIVLVILHFLPGIIASSRKHPQAVPIWLVNIFLGWTVIGWFAALIWAFVTERSVVAVPVYAPQPYPPQPYAQPTPPPGSPMASPAVAPPTSSASPPAGVSAMADEIAALARLRDQGVLTDAEFTARKHLLLTDDGHAPVVPPPPQAV